MQIPWWVPVLDRVPVLGRVWLPVLPVLPVPVPVLLVRVVPVPDRALVPDRGRAAVFGPQVRAPG